MTVTAPRQAGSAVQFLRLLCLSLCLTSCIGAKVALAQAITTGPTSKAAQEDSKQSKTEKTVDADSEITTKYTRPLESFKLSVDGYEAAVKEATTSDDRLKEMPAQLDQLRLKIRAYIDTLKPLRKQSVDRQTKLGPAPNEGAAAEAVELAAERARIVSQIAAYESLIKNSELLIVRALQITESANTIRRNRFSDRILSPIDNFYLPSFWAVAPGRLVKQFVDAGEALVEALASVAQQRPWRGLVCLLLPFFVAMSLWKAIRSRQTFFHFEPLTEVDQPNRIELGARAVVKIIRRSVPIVVGLVLAYLLILRFDIFAPPGDEFLFNSLSSIGFAWVLFVSNHQLFSPWDPRERFISADAIPAIRVGHILSILIGVWLIDSLFANLDDYLRSPLVVTVVRSLIASLSIAGLIFLLLRIRLRSEAKDARARMNSWPAPLFLFLTVTVFGICIACLLGYVALGRFVGSQVIATGGIGLLMYLSHLAAEHLSSVSLKAANAEANASDGISTRLSITTFRIMAGLAVDMMILVVGIPAILLQWGFDWAEVRSWLLAAFFGFQIGDYTVSIQAALVAIFMLVGGVLITRVIQRWFLKRSDVGLRSDTGVRESIYAGLGYLGFALSVMAAVSYLGINFANLAIIVGALSVGIGFGLQSIVNNFVSGLIMLVERPIKSGDWISVGESDGLVRRISVRATELETLDKQSIIVPNSEFISKPVTNWMYKERIGRINVGVGVSYDSDVDVVERVLLEAARANKFVLPTPAPSVIFENFGDSSLDFLLRVFISDMEHKMPASSSIRFSIWRALKEAGINIPFPQRDIHVKEIQEVSRIVERPRLQKVDT